MIFKISNTQSLQLFYLLRQGAMIFTSILLAKSRLTLGEIGTYELLLFISYTLSFWWISGLVQGLLTTYPRLSDIEQRQFTFNAYAVFVGISVGIFLLFTIFKTSLLTLLIGQSEVSYFYIFLIFILLNFPTYLLENLLLLQEKPKEIARYGIVFFLSQPLAVLLPVYLGLDFEWSIIGLVIVASLKHLWLLINIWQNGLWQLQWKMIQKWMWLSIPLIIYALLGGFNVAFDNWLVNYHYQNDAAQFAIFRYGAQELPFTLALTNALSAALLPEIVKDLPKALPSIKAKSLQLFHLLFPLSIMLVLTSKWLFPLVFNPAFSASVDVFNIFLLILISRLIMSRPILMALQANRGVLIISVFELIINGVLSFILLQYWGMVGVAVGTLVAYTFEKILLCTYLYVRFGVPVQAYTSVKWLSIYGVALLVAYYFS